VIDLPKSTFYYRATTRTAKISDAELVSLIEDIQDELPCYGIDGRPASFAAAGAWSITSASLG
jgi:hypothetical protein